MRVLWPGEGGYPRCSRVSKPGGSIVEGRCIEADSPVQRTVVHPVDGIKDQALDIEPVVYICAWFVSGYGRENGCAESTAKSTTQ